MKKLIAHIKAKRDEVKWWLFKYYPEIIATAALAFTAMVAMLLISFVGSSR